MSKDNKPNLVVDVHTPFFKENEEVKCTCNKYNEKDVSTLRENMKHNLLCEFRSFDIIGMYNTILMGKLYNPQDINKLLNITYYLCLLHAQHFEAEEIMTFIKNLSTTNKYSLLYILVKVIGIKFYQQHIDDMYV